MVEKYLGFIEISGMKDKVYLEAQLHKYIIRE